MSGDGRSSEFGVPPSNDDSPTLKPATVFRWQALLQRSSDPIFLLNRRRRILFVNRPWEELTGLSAGEARGLICLRRTPAAGDPWDVIIRILCCPTQEVLDGTAGRVRRLVPRTGTGERWWNIDFLPLAGQGELLCILGRILRLPNDNPPGVPPLPERLAALRETRKQLHSLDKLTSGLPELKRVSEQIRLAARSGSPALLVGEPGTGKEWVARAIHCQRVKGDAPFVALDCDGLPARALESVLFAPNSECWTGGTCYLKEPARLPRDLQRRLYDRFNGGDENHGTQLLAGTRTNPVQAVDSGALLDELYCFLSPLTITLPPLRDRQADLSGFVNYFVECAGALRKQPEARLSEEAWQMLRHYGWPGNLSELYNALRSASEHAGENEIEPSHLPSALRLAVRMEQTTAAVPDSPVHLDHILQGAERRLIVQALRKARGNKSKAAELLSIWRPRLIRRMQALGITDP
jgi:transcriptional regulator with AAA-type ATPase domain